MNGMRMAGRQGGNHEWYPLARLDRRCCSLVGILSMVLLMRIVNWLLSKLFPYQLPSRFGLIIAAQQKHSALDE